jgi:hypothetical protein
MRDIQTIDESAIEQLLGQVRGVLAVRVVADAQGQIDEIHVVGTPERSPKAMVRDVESLLYVRGGIRLDHRKISLVQMAETVIQPTVVRVQLVELAWSASGEQPEVMITLSMGDRRFQGISRGGSESAEPPEMLIGYATIHALDQLIGPRGQFRLENLQRQPFGEIEVCLSHLSLTTDDGIETLLGISVVRGGDQAAIARAVLDAVNRRLQRLLGGER